MKLENSNFELVRIEEDVYINWAQVSRLCFMNYTLENINKTANIKSEYYKSNGWHTEGNKVIPLLCVSILNEVFRIPITENHKKNFKKDPEKVLKDFHKFITSEA